MRVQDHIGLISWSLADKGLFIFYGFVLIIIMRYTEPAEFGLFSLLIALHTWIFTISDSFSLQSLIQFGMNENNRKKVNLLALISHIVLTFGASLIIFIFRHPLAELFSEPRIVEIATFLPVLSIAFIPRTYSQKIIYRIQNMFYLFLTNFIFFGTISSFIFLNITSTKLLTFTDLAYYYLFGSFASSTIAVILINKHLRFSHKGEISWRSIYGFSWKMTAINLLHSFPRNMDIFIIKIFFSLETVGLYAAAKNLFRVFDEILNAMNGLVYPSAVKNFQNNNKKALFALMTKSVSFIFLGYAGLVLVLEMGLSDWIISIFLNEKYINAIKYFNILIIAAPFLAFNIFYTILTAQDKLNIVLKSVFMSNIFYTCVLLTISSMGYVKVIPLGIVSYYVILGLIGFYWGNKKMGFRNKYLLEAFNNTINFIKNRMEK